MGVGLVLFALSLSGALRPVEDLSIAVLSPVEEGLQNIVRPLADVITNINDVRDLTGENERLRLENERLSSEIDRKSTRLNSSHIQKSRMPSSA